jgi:hypothetical protein
VLRESVYIEDRDISGLDGRIRASFRDPSADAVAELLALLGLATGLVP